MSEGAQAALLPRRPPVLAAAMMVIFMAAVESTIIATAMPTIVADPGGFRLFSWVFAAYLLTQAVTIPIHGRLADLYGRKRTFLAGASLFLAASVLCGLARSMGVPILFRGSNPRAKICPVRGRRDSRAAGTPPMAPAKLSAP